MSQVHAGEGGPPGSGPAVEASRAQRRVREEGAGAYMRASKEWPRECVEQSDGVHCQVPAHPLDPQPPLCWPTDPKPRCSAAPAPGAHLDPQLPLRQRQRLAGRHPQLPLHQVLAGDGLGHRVLHLRAAKKRVADVTQEVSARHTRRLPLHQVLAGDGFSDWVLHLCTGRGETDGSPPCGCRPVGRLAARCTCAGSVGDRRRRPRARAARASNPASTNRQHAGALACRRGFVLQFSRSAALPPLNQHHTRQAALACRRVFISQK